MEYPKPASELSLVKCDKGYLLDGISCRDYLGYDLPVSVINRFGCLNCELRGTRLCPVETGDSGVVYPSEGICGTRLLWLYSLCGSYSEYPGWDRWYRDFLLNLGNGKMLESIRLEKVFDLKLEELDSRKDVMDNDTYLNLRNQLLWDKRLHLQTWSTLWKKMLHYTDNYVGRDSVKKVATYNVSVKPSDVAEKLHSSDTIVKLDVPCTVPNKLGVAGSSDNN